MLDRAAWRDWGRRHLEASSYSLRGLWQKPFSTLMTVMVLSVTLTLPLLFWVLGHTLEQLTTHWQSQAQLSLYLPLEVNEAQMQTILRAVRQVSGVSKATLKTPAEALASLETQEGMQDIIKYLPSNPLPALIEVSPETHTPASLARLVADLKKIPQIDHIQLETAWMQRLHAIWIFVRLLFQGVMGLLGVSVILIIGNTLRLTLHHRQHEIQVLKLMGAADAYIMRPFVYAGIWYGVLGAVGAMLWVSIFLFYLGRALGTILSFYQVQIPWMGLTVTQTYSLLLFSAALGWISAQCFVRRRLDYIDAER